jgi:hypothetical protein
MLREIIMDSGKPVWLCIDPAYQREVKSARDILILSILTAEKTTICSLKPPRMIASAARAQFLVSTAEMSGMLGWREASILQWTTTTRLIDVDIGKVDLSFHGLRLQT